MFKILLYLYFWLNENVSHFGSSIRWVCAFMQGLPPPPQQPPALLILPTCALSDTVGETPGGPSFTLGLTIIPLVFQ